MDVFVGIDVSKARLDVHVEPSQDVFVVTNDLEGLAGLIARLEGLSPKIVALEATGGLEAVAAGQMAAAGLPVVVVNPAQVRAFANAVGQRAKIDPIDGGDRPLRAGGAATGAALAGRGDARLG